MEDDKKRRKNKKKKNKQQTNHNNNNNNKVATGESTSVDPEGRVSENAQNTNGQALEYTDTETDVMHNSERQPSSGVQGASIEEKIKQFQNEKDVHKEKEAILEAKIEHVLKEKDIVLQKEASLEEKLKQLQNEKQAYEEREDTLEKKLIQLQKEREAHMQKEVSLEEKVRKMEMEKESFMQKEHDLEMKVMELQSEKQTWLQKEAGLEDKINQLMDETATLSLKGVSLEERIKEMERERDSWVQSENSRKETIKRLDGDNTNLRAEVMELKELRSSLLKENQLLKENLSGLESHIQNLEKHAAFPFSSIKRQMDTSENGHANSEIDAASMLIEKLITENPELGEKVNALYVEIAQRGFTAEASPTVDFHPESGPVESADVVESSIPASKQVVEAAQRHETGQDLESVLDSSMKMPSPGERLQSMEEAVIKDERTVRDSLNANHSMLLPNSSEIIESDKVVQIPLDENEIQVVNSEAAYNEETPDVPFTDAPLIGAPFRLISFVARYVSGADLVNKSAAP